MFLINAETTKNSIIASFIKDSKRCLRKVDFNPKLYLYNYNGSFRSIYNEPLSEFTFNSLKDYNQFLKDNDVEQIYGNISPKYQFIREHFKDKNNFDLSQVNVCYFDIEVSTLTKDDPFIGFPEANIAPIPIVAIAIYSTLNNKMTVFGLNDYNPKETLFPSINTQYIQCKDEERLLTLFASYLCNNSTRPDFLYGWNSNSFDLPYIHNRMLKIGGTGFVNKLSPFGNVYSMNAMKRWNGQNIPYLKYNIVGVPHLDMMDVYLKFSGRTGSFALNLNSVAQHDLGEKKLDYGASRSLKDMFYDNHQRYIDYNIYDTFLLKLLDDKNGLSHKLLGASIENKCNLIDTLGTTKQWETIMYNAYMDNGMITPPKIQHEKVSYSGGFVRQSITGVKRWVKVFDFTSLYPMIMIGQNMSPETLLKEYKAGCVVTPNNVYFDRTKQGVFGQVAEKFFQGRITFKKLHKEYKENGDSILANKYDVLQYVYKILLNSGYGAFANSFFLFFKQEIAASITAMGQVAIKRIADRLNLLMNELCGTIDGNYFDYELSDFEEITDIEDFIVMGDTDSCGLSFEVYVDKFLKGKSDKEIAEHLVELYNTKVAPTIKDCLTKLQTEYNFYKHTLTMNFETLSKKSIFLQKKRYLGHVVYDDGTYCLDYSKPKFKIKGVEGIKSSTSAYFQEKFMKFYELCLLSNNNDEIRNYIKEVEEDYKSLYVIETGKPIKVKSLEKYADDKKIYRLGTPEHIKGCLIYNHYIKKLGLEGKYNLLREGDYAKLLKLNPNNGFKNVNKQGYIVSETVICVPDDDILPPELDLDNFIGYKMQFDKFFNNACTDVLDTMNIKTKKFKGLL